MVTCTVGEENLTSEYLNHTTPPTINSLGLWTRATSRNLSLKRDPTESRAALGGSVAAVSWTPPTVSFSRGGRKKVTPALEKCFGEPKIEELEVFVCFYFLLAAGGEFLLNYKVLSLPESNSSHLKKWNPKRTESFCNHQFSYAMLVSGRVLGSWKNEHLQLKSWVKIYDMILYVYTTQRNHVGKYLATFPLECGHFSPSVGK